MLSTVLLSARHQATAPAGTALPTLLSVQVGDAYGNPVSGVTVNWAVASGGGSLSAPTSQAGANGVASVQLTLGGEPGSETASATAPGLARSPVTFSANATPNGTISGTITLANSFLAPPRTTTLAAGGKTLAALTRTKTLSGPSLSPQATQRRPLASTSTKRRNGNALA